MEDLSVLLEVIILENRYKLFITFGNYQVTYIKKIIFNDNFFSLLFFFLSFGILLSLSKDRARSIIKDQNSAHEIGNLLKV